LYNALKKNGFPFDVAQGGEPVEPRVKPGMTIAIFYDISGFQKGGLLPFYLTISVIGRYLVF
jgi:hypothetical protein